VASGGGKSLTEMNPKRQLVEPSPQYVLFAGNRLGPGDFTSLGAVSFRW